MGKPVMSQFRRDRFLFADLDLIMSGVIMKN